MKSCFETKKDIQDGKYAERFLQLYVDQNRADLMVERYCQAIDTFMQIYPAATEIEIYSAPGRSEVCGNHTDHQNGQVLATSINLDAIAIVSPLEENVIRLVSESAKEEVINLDDLSMKKEEEGTTASLIRGVAAKIKEDGYHIGGFCAYVTSDVLVGAGLSSSAAFESLIGTILSGLYNDMKISSVRIAQIGQMAENLYFGKPCGLMDQMACSVGGMITIDFKDKEKPRIEQVESDFEQAGYSVCILDTKGSHVDLTPDYAAVPKEMKEVAAFFGKEVLREVSEEAFYENIANLREQVSDRSILRSIHFYEENKRVVNAVSALKSQDYERFFEMLFASGQSSMKILQNAYSTKDVAHQNMTLALTLTEQFLKGKGACRVHGGGFAGTILAFVKNEEVENYRKMTEKIFGDGACHVLKVRPYGGVRV